MKNQNKDALEKDIQKVIVEWLRLKKLQVSVTDASRIGGRSKVDVSHPDLTVVLPVLAGSPEGSMLVGLAFYIEVKTESGAIKEGQKEKLLSLSDQGAIAIIARDLDMVRVVVNAFYKKPVTMSKMLRVNEILNLQMKDRRDPTVRVSLSNAASELAKLG